MMSNALSMLPDAWRSAASHAAAAVAAGAAPPPAPVEILDPTAISPPLMSLLAVGICVLVVCVVRRAIRPRKLTLIGTPGRPNRVNPLHVLFLLAVWYGSQQAATLVVGRFFEQATHEFTVLVVILIQLPWLLACLLVARMTFSLGLRRGLGLSGRHWIYDTARGVIGYLAVLPLCVGLLHLSLQFLQTHLPGLVKQMQEDNLLDHPMLRALGEAPFGWKIGVLLSAGILAPLVEELFFRGIFQSMLRRYTRRPWVAILATSAFFAAFHLPLWHNMPTLFVLSVVLGYNYERSGRLVSPMVIHALFNGVFLAIRLAGGS